MNVWFWAPPNERQTLHPTPVPQLWGGQPASQPAPATTSQPASQPAAIQRASSSAKSSSKIPKSPSSRPKPMKTYGFHRFLLCQPGRLQHEFLMPKAPQVTPSDIQRQSRSFQAHPKCSLEAPKVTPNIPIWSHGPQSELNLSPGAPKIHPKTSKMLPK